MAGATSQIDRAFRLRRGRHFDETVTFVCLKRHVDAELEKMFRGTVCVTRLRTPRHTLSYQDSYDTKRRFRLLHCFVTLSELCEEVG